MSTFWFTINVFFAIVMFRSATDEVYEKSKFVWLMFLFFSAWNAASAAMLL